MLVDVTTTFLEMTSPDQLVPGEPPPVEMRLDRIDQTQSALYASTFAAVGAPHHWTGRSGWPAGQWMDHLARQEIRTYLAYVGGDLAGIVELEAHADADVEINSFGLFPEFVGKGLGGHLLTLATRLAWELEHRGGARTTRVWLHTNTLDHPHAMPNYERRGFRPFRTVTRSREIP